MLNYGERSRGSSRKRRDEEDDEEEEEIREIHALTPPRPPPPPHRRRDAWEGHSRGSSSVSMASTEVASIDNFTSMSREFSALVLAGSTINSRNYNSSHVHVGDEGGNNNYNLGRIGEEEETNPLAIVADHNPLIGSVGSGSRGGESEVVVSVQRVKKEEVAAKISAWQNAKIAKINNRFKREDAVITAWETDHLHKATSWMKKVERKLEEKRARALEKMQNDIAKAKRKAEEKRASAEGKRGTKVARVLEMASLMRAVGKFPAKRSFF